MNRDLERQLDELGPECRAVVMRLRAAREAAQGTRDEGRGTRRWLVAASLILFVGLGVFFQASRPLGRSTSQPPYGAHEYTMGIDEMIATQNADGSWKNDFLTRRNAAALKLCGTPAARIAYKKALRNLRVRGVL